VGHGGGGGRGRSSNGAPQCSQNLIPGAIFFPHFSQSGTMDYHIEYKSEALYYYSGNKSPPYQAIGGHLKRSHMWGIP